MFLFLFSVWFRGSLSVAKSLTLVRHVLNNTAYYGMKATAPKEYKYARIIHYSNWQIQYPVLRTS
jgi:hypothetical protein